LTSLSDLRAMMSALEPIPRLSGTRYRPWFGR
jgi:hypothetical protein